MNTDTQQTRPNWRWMKVIRKIFKWLGLVLLVLLVAALTIEAALKYRDKDKYPPPGKLYQLQSHQMHLWCEGSSNKPVIILDTGASMFSSGWRWVIDDLADSHRVCAFDRSGLGWSERGPEPYDGIQASTELRALLQAADIPFPFVYVGHSLGAMLGRVYYQQYPDDLAALVMIEPANPEILIQEISEDRGEAVQRNPEIKPCGLRCPMMSLASHLGVARYMMNTIEIINDSKFHPQALAEYKARTIRSENMRFLGYRGRYITEIAFQTGDNDSLGDLPVAMIYSNNFGELLGDHDNEQEYLEDRAAAIKGWEETLRLSSRSLGLHLIPDANHLTIVAYQKPAEQIADVVRMVMEEIEKD